MNELLQLYLSDVQPRLQLATAQAMYVALDKCSDVVHITDQNLNVQVNTCACNIFVSSSGRSALDWVEEIGGRRWTDLIRLRTGTDVYMAVSDVPWSVKDGKCFGQPSYCFLLKKAFFSPLGLSVFSLNFSSFCTF